MPPLHKLNIRNHLLLLAVIWFGCPPVTFAQEPAPQDQEQTADEATAIDGNDNNTNDGQTAEIETESSEPAMLGQPTQFIYSEEKRAPLLSDELRHIRGDAQTLEMTVSDETVIGIWQQDLSGEPLGAALILPPANISPSSIEIRNLQYYLALNGWASLTMASLAKDVATAPPVSPIATPGKKTKQDTLEEESDQQEPPNQTEEKVDESEVIYQEPETSTPEEPSATTANDTSNGDAATEPRISSQERMLERIEIGLNALKEKNYFNNVLIAYEGGAQYFAKFTSKASPQNTSSLQALVLINTEIRDDDSSATLDPLINLELPTLDIINQPFPIATLAQTGRHNRAKQLKHPRYIARKLALGETNTQKENNLSRAIRGFITRYAAGTETNR